MAFEGGEVDGVGDVRGQELVGFAFEPSPVGGEFREFGGAGGEAFIECGRDLLREVCVLGSSVDAFRTGGLHFGSRSFLSSLR